MKIQHRHYLTSLFFGASMGSLYYQGGHTIHDAICLGMLGLLVMSTKLSEFDRQKQG